MSVCPLTWRKNRRKRRFKLVVLITRVLITRGTHLIARPGLFTLNTHCLANLGWTLRSWLIGGIFGGDGRLTSSMWAIMIRPSSFRVNRLHHIHTLKRQGSCNTWMGSMIKQVEQRSDHRYVLAYTEKDLSNEIDWTSKFVCYRQISLQPI